MTDFRQFSALIREAAQRHGASWSEALCNEIAALAAWNGYGAVGATWDDPGDAGSDDDLGPLPVAAAWAASCRSATTCSCGSWR